MRVKSFGWRAAGKFSRVLSLLPACALAAALCRTPELHLALVLRCSGGLRWIGADDIQCVLCLAARHES